MFSLASGAYQAYMAQQQVNVLIVGASGVGKTTLLERLKVTQFRKQGVVVLSEDVESPLLQAMHQHRNGGGDEDELIDHQDDSSSSVLVSPQTTTLPGRIVSRRRVVDVPTPTQVNGSNNVSHPSTRSNNTQGFWTCPSPSKYQNAVTDDGSDVDNDDDGEQSPLQTRSSGPLQTIDMSSSSRRTPIAKTTSLPPLPPSTTPIEYDLKPNARMLPLVKIRPTIGMNLGQFQHVYGAKCHVWDVGGRLHNLWERYYDDCDAVIFVLKWEDDDDDDEIERETATNTNTDDDDDSPPRPTRQEQKLLLQTVRRNIPEHVPFLMFLHSWQSPTTTMYEPQEEARIYRSTEPLLPTLPMTQALCVGNAGTGQGVRAAMEWLLPLAQQQQRLRDKLPPSSANEEIDPTK